MSLTTVSTRTKGITFRREITREYVRENLFSPYMGEDITAIIRTIRKDAKGGETINIPLVGRLSAGAIGTGTLVGNEENIDNYGFRLWIDWARNAVVTNRAEELKDSTDIFGEARPLLSDWGKELQRDEIILSMHALSSISPPAGLASTAGQRANGVLYSAATATQKNSAQTANSDRMLFGASTANLVAGNHAASLANIDNTADKLTGASLKLLKRIAKRARPRIRPFKTTDGREYFVLFAGSNAFRDFGNDAEVQAANRDARAREGNGMDRNPIFQDGDLLLNGVIVREIPEMDELTTVTGAGAGGINVAPVFLCGQGALAFAWGQMPRPTERKEDDYGFLTGVGVEMAYGIAKVAKAREGATDLTDWGIATGYFASVSDA